MFDDGTIADLAIDVTPPLRVGVLRQSPLYDMTRRTGHLSDRLDEHCAVRSVSLIDDQKAYLAANPLELPLEPAA